MGSRHLHLVTWMELRYHVVVRHLMGSMFYACSLFIRWMPLPAACTSMESEQKIVANRANVPTKGDNIFVMPRQRCMYPERYPLSLRRVVRHQVLITQVWAWCELIHCMLRARSVHNAVQHFCSSSNTCLSMIGQALLSQVIDILHPW